MPNLTVAISSDFLSAYAALPRKIQQKTSTFINKFRADPTSKGIHLEKVGNTDGKFYSVRIDLEYRGIVAKQDDTYLILWVDHHDEAYRWASRRRCEVNAITGSLQVYEVAQEAPAPVVETPGIFDSITDEQLLELGVPKDTIPLVRTITTADSLDRYSGSLPADALEGLMWLANDFGFDEVMELLREERDPGPSANNLTDALHNRSTQRSFVVVEGEEDLYRLLSAPLEKWRTFLHPSQRTVVDRNYSGPARVLGGAGTGKTVVAMHRARALAMACGSGERILFTTFSTNLAKDIEENLGKLCGREELAHIEVRNLDSWVAQFVNSQGLDYRITYDQAELEDLWSDAIALSGRTLDFEPSFFVDEWAQVILALDDPTLANYVHAKRVGRGNRLTRKDRMAIWDVAECYNELMKERGVKDVDAAMRDARLILEGDPASVPYRHIIVDEGQDFSAPAYRLIRALAGVEHPNDIFIVGDSHQRIYGKRAVLSRCGINVRGRSRRLRINYRTPEEIRRAAVAVIADLSWDDLDDGVDTDDVVQSLVHGQKPELKVLRDITAEIDWIAEQIKAMAKAGSDLRDVCVALRTNNLVDQYARGLRERGLETMVLKARRVDDRSVEGVRVATMHRVKGLEFDEVFLANMSEGVVPSNRILQKARREGNEDTVIQEERSLIYVAMTRAKRGTTITAAGKMTKLIRE